MRIMKATFADEAPYWVVCIGPDSRVYGYLSATNKFHFSHGLDTEYYWDHDLIFADIDPTEAVDLINSGIGKFEEEKAWVIERLTQAEWSLSADEVLGEASAAIERSTH